MQEKIDKKFIIHHIQDRFMIANDYYWFSDNETDCDEDDRDLRSVGGKPQFINYSWG